MLRGGRWREDELGKTSEAMVGAAQRWWRHGWVQEEAAWTLPEEGLAGALEAGSEAGWSLAVGGSSER